MFIYFPLLISPHVFIPRPSLFGFHRKNAFLSLQNSRSRSLFGYSFGTSLHFHFSHWPLHCTFATLLLPFPIPHLSLLLYFDFKSVCVSNFISYNTNFTCFYIHCMFFFVPFLDFIYGFVSIDATYRCGGDPFVYICYTYINLEIINKLGIESILLTELIGNQIKSKLLILLRKFMKNIFFLFL